MPTPRPSLPHVSLSAPAEHLANVIGGMREPSLLHGAPGFGESGRWSLYAAEPRLVFEADDLGWRILADRPDERASGTGDPLPYLSTLIDRFGLGSTADEPLDNVPPFQGGLIGYLGYDLAPRIERLPRRAIADSRFPILRFGLYDTAVQVDHQTGRAVLSAFDLPGGDDPARRLERWRSRLLHDPATPFPSRLDTEITSNFTPADYQRSVGQALEYIRAGDIFQVNLSQRFGARGRFDPLDLSARLRSVSPAPFAAMLRWDDLAIISASPELFHETKGDRILTRPIKGTRPRGATPDEDAALAEALRASPKDRAELTMIVDLERNDLGRVCRYGSVRVVDALSVETFAQVHHLVATVEGRLRPDAGPVDVVRAIFPGGSITGAPKIRAMEIIDELEPTRRGPYTGAIGYFGRGGRALFNIAIRTLLVEGDRVSYQVGGGIVADSDPRLEYEETLHKGRGLRAVLEGAGR